MARRIRVTCANRKIFKALKNKQALVAGYAKAFSAKFLESNLCEVCRSYGANAKFNEMKVCWDKECRAVAREIPA